MSQTGFGMQDRRCPAWWHTEPTLSGTHRNRIAVPRHEDHYSAVPVQLFMTIAWYAHLKDLYDKPWIIAALVSWGVALFEYLLQVPANRAGYGQFDLGQLKIMQEIIALTLCVPFALYYMKEPLRLDFDARHPWRAALRAELKFAQFRSRRNCLWAGLCLVGAAYFMSRAPVSGGA